MDAGGRLVLNGRRRAGWPVHLEADMVGRIRFLKTAGVVFLLSAL